MTKPHSLGCPAGKSCAAQHLDGKCSMDNTCVCSSQSVQKEEIREELRKKFPAQSVEHYIRGRRFDTMHVISTQKELEDFFDYDFDRISASVREETRNLAKETFDDFKLPNPTTDEHWQWNSEMDEIFEAFCKKMESLSALQKLSDNTSLAKE